MIVSASITIHASKAAVWSATADIARFAELLSGVEKIDIVENPSAGLIGLKWKETRILFGKPAAVEKWITEAKEKEFYTTRAEQDGFVFITTNRISGSDGSVVLSGIHETRPQGFAAKLKALPMVFFKGVIKKAILQDLKDIKAAVEKGSMNSEAVHCSTHGAANGTYICEHLFRASGLAWYSAQPDEQSPWPDAWCGECHKVYEREGEWNEVNEGEVKIQLICHHCYERTKTKCSVHYI